MRSRTTAAKGLPSLVRPLRWEDIWPTMVTVSPTISLSMSLREMIAYDLALSATSLQGFSEMNVPSNSLSHAIFSC